jgi:plastocyanin
MIVVAIVALLGLAVAHPAAAEYVETTVADGGTLTGVVRFGGTPPAFPPLAVNKNRDVCGDSKPNEALVLGPDKGVRGSVVRIEAITKGKKAADDVVIDNHKCLFVPHVAATMVGARARVKNSDAILHNTHGFLGKPTVFNVALPTAGQVVDITRRLTKTGAVRILCDAHPHMMGWLVVHDSPYVTTTDEKGAFRIDGIPPGTYKVSMWHEGFRQKGTDKDGRPQYEDPVTVTREIQIVPKATATLDFELK